MDVDKILWNGRVLSEPFALIAGSALSMAQGEVEAAFRRMGLQPQRVAVGDAAVAGDGPWFRLTLGTLTVRAGEAAAAMLDAIDPAHPDISRLATALPAGWRGDRASWMFIPELSSGGTKVSPGELREFFKLLVLLIDMVDASHLFWSPARLWSDAPQFRAAVSEMLTSGMPPVLHLVAFRQHIHASGDGVATRGLALFTDQELEAGVPAGWDMAAMVKRLARLALDLMVNGPMTRAQETPGLEPGEWVGLTPMPAANGRPATVRVEFSRER